MRTSKIDKPGKVYVVTSKTKQGSVGNSSGGKVRFVGKYCFNGLNCVCMTG